MLPSQYCLQLDEDVHEVGSHYAVTTTCNTEPRYTYHHVEKRQEPCASILYCIKPNTNFNAGL